MRWRRRVGKSGWAVWRTANEVNVPPSTLLPNFAERSAPATLPGGLPIVSPPYSVLVAIDLNRAGLALRWQKL